MELPRKLFEQLAFNTRPNLGEHMLIIMDKSTHEQHLSQPLQTNNKQFKLAVTFLSACNRLFNVTNSNDKFYFKKALIDEDFIQITIPPGAYQIESLDDEIKKIIFDKDQYTEANCTFRIKPNFITLGSIGETLTQ